MTKYILASILSLILGTTIVFAQADTTAVNQKEEGQQLEYGNNIIRIAPLVVQPNNINIGAGFGLSYERIIGVERKMSFILPITITLSDMQNDYNFDYSNSKARYLTFYSFSPGIKFYPGGQKDISYSLGANLLFSYGEGKGDRSYTVRVLDSSKSYTSYNYINKTETLTKQEFSFGFLINNYVNFQISKTVNIGIVGGLGVIYVNNVKLIHSNSIPSENRNQPLQPTFNLSFSFGFRF